MNKQSKLMIRQMDDKIRPFADAVKVTPPEKGWIASLRQTLNMTLEQLGMRMNTSRQGAKNIENREAAGTITLKALKEAASALNMHFVYAFVPREGSIEALIHERANLLARKIVLRTSHNMRLENQENTREQLSKAIDDLTDEIKTAMHKSLWD